MDVAVGETGARRRKRQRVSTSTPPSSDAPKVARRQVRPKKQLHEEASSQGHHRQVSYHSPNNQHPYWQALIFAPGLGGCRMRLVRTESFSCFLHGHNEAMAKAHGFRDSAHYAAACPTAADLEASARATKRLRVLASAHLCVRLDVDALAPKFASCQLRASGGPLIITRRSPECTIKLFEDGSVTCAGAASVEEARLALKQVARRCLTTGASVKFRMFKITAIDGEFRVPLRVCLYTLGREPIAYWWDPGLVRIECARMDTELQRMSAHVYACGTVSLYGLASEQDFDRAARLLAPVLVRHRQGLLLLPG